MQYKLMILTIHPRHPTARRASFHGAAAASKISCQHTDFLIYDLYFERHGLELVWLGSYSILMTSTLHDLYPPCNYDPYPPFMSTLFAGIEC
jgi:hypothetical protein